MFHGLFCSQARSCYFSQYLEFHLLIHLNRKTLVSSGWQQSKTVSSFYYQNHMYLHFHISTAISAVPLKIYKFSCTRQENMMQILTYFFNLLCSLFNAACSRTEKWYLPIKEKWRKMVKIRLRNKNIITITDWFSKTSLLIFVN